jgi:beta-lactamase class A
MIIDEDLKRMDEERRAWLSAKLDFRATDEAKHLAVFKKLQKTAYGKLRKAYKEQGMSFNRHKIMRMLSI